MAIGLDGIPLKFVKLIISSILGCIDFQKVCERRLMTVFLLLDSSTRPSIPLYNRSPHKIILETRFYLRTRPFLPFY
jgi:hypothetical protein